MSFNVAMLEAMQAEGLDLAACIRILRSAGPDTAAEKRRAYDRQRKREKREIERMSGGKSAGNPPDGFPNDNDILTPSLPQDGSDEPSPPCLEPEHVVEAWNATADRLGLPAVRKLTPERRRKLKTRIRQNTIDEFTEAISAIERSRFLRGDNDRGWRPNLDWMLEPRNFTKLIEGTYDR